MQKEHEEIAHKKMVNSDQKRQEQKSLADLLRAKLQTPLTESLDLESSI